MAEREQLDDRALVTRILEGDRDRFTELVRRYEKRLINYVFRITHRYEEAHDLAQEIFMKVYLALDRYDPKYQFSTWLFRIAINESRNRFRWWKCRRRELTISMDANIGDSETPLSDMLADASESPEETALVREREYALKAALQELPVVFRETIVLCDVEGFSYEETAKALGIGMGTVKSRISRGREELRRKLKDF